MVDVGDKAVTRRSPPPKRASSCPRTWRARCKRSGHRTKKGPVFDTAIIAGVMAAKRTHELIPFCHPLPLQGVTIDIRTRPGGLRGAAAR